jgi:hypothetical protein
MWVPIYFEMKDPRQKGNNTERLLEGIRNLCGDQEDARSAANYSPPLSRFGDRREPSG